MKKFNKIFGKESGMLVMAIGVFVIGGISILTSNYLYKVGSKAVAPNAPGSNPEAAGNCTLSYSLDTTTASTCPSGTSLLFTRTGSLSNGATVSANGRISSLSGTWSVRSQNGKLLAEGGSRMTVSFPTNVVLDSVLIYDNDPKTGESPWSINGVSLPTTPGNVWGPLFPLNLTASQMVFNNGGDSPHFNVCVKTTTSSTTTPTPTVTTGGTGGTGQIQIIDDGYVRSGAPNTVYNGTSLYTNATQEKVIYMKLDLTSLAGRTINSANLNMYVTNVNSGTVYIKSASGSWSESTLNYNNRPTLGSTITNFTSPGSAGAWKSINLTSYVNQYKGQVVTIAIQATKLNDDLIFRSSESSGNKPYLSIQ